MSKAKKKVVAVVAGLAFVCAMMLSTGIVDFGADSSINSAAVDSELMKVAGDPEHSNGGG